MGVNRKKNQKTPALEIAMRLIWKGWNKKVFTNQTTTSAVLPLITGQGKPRRNSKKEKSTEQYSSEEEGTPSKRVSCFWTIHSIIVTGQRIFLDDAKDFTLYA